MILKISKIKCLQGRFRVDLYCDTLLSLCRYNSFNYENNQNQNTKQKYIANIIIKLAESQRTTSYYDPSLQV